MTSLFGVGSSAESRSNIIREVHLLFPLYRLGTAWDFVERAMNHESRPWPFNEKKILWIIMGVAKALEAMHKSGYAHRDIKPHNILLDDAKVQK